MWPWYQPPRLLRIRVEIEQPDGSVRTTVLTTGRGIEETPDGVTTFHMDAADMDANEVILLSDEQAARWLKRLKKRGIT